MKQEKPHQDLNDTYNIPNIVVPYRAEDIANNASWSDANLIL